MILGLDQIITKEVILATVPALIVLVSVFITQIFNEKRRKGEALRWYADYFIKERIKNFLELNANLHDAYDVINLHSAAPLLTDREFREKVLSKTNNFRRSMAIASAYLHSEAAEALKTFAKAMNQAETAIYMTLPDNEMPKGFVRKSYPPEISVIDYLSLSNSFKQACQFLNDEINPPELDKEQLLK